MAAIDEFDKNGADEHGGEAPHHDHRESRIQSLVTEADEDLRAGGDVDELADEVVEQPARASGLPPKKLIAAAVAVVVVIFGGSQWYAQHKRAQMDAETQLQEAAQAAPAPATLQDLQRAASAPEQAASGAMGQAQVQPALQPQPVLQAASAAAPLVVVASPAATPALAASQAAAGGATASLNVALNSTAPTKLPAQPGKDVPSADFVTKDQFDELVRRIAALEQAIKASAGAKAVAAAEHVAPLTARPSRAAAAPVAGTPRAVTKQGGGAARPAAGEAKVEQPKLALIPAAPGQLSEPQQTATYVGPKIDANKAPKAYRTDYTIYAQQDGIFWYRSSNGEIGSTTVNGRLPDGSVVLGIRSSEDGRKEVQTDRGLIK